MWRLNIYLAKARLWYWKWLFLPLDVILTSCKVSVFQNFAFMNHRNVGICWVSWHRLSTSKVNRSSLQHCQPEVSRTQDNWYWFRTKCRMLHETVTDWEFRNRHFNVSKLVLVQSYVSHWNFPHCSNSLAKQGKLFIEFISNHRSRHNSGDLYHM